MKRKLVLMVVLVAAMIGGGTGAVLAGYGPGGCSGGPQPGPGGFEGRMAKVLKLTDTQQSQIKAILDAEREQNKTLFDKMHENRKLLLQAGEATTFDETTVRALAAGQAQLEAELTVSRIKVQTQINTILTSDQREMLKNLRPDPDRKPHAPPAGNSE
jgi:protein CpxP